FCSCSCYTNLSVMASSSCLCLATTFLPSCARELKMEKWVGILVCLSFLVTVFSAMSSDGETKTYIVHVAKSQKPTEFLSHENWYASAVQSVIREEDQAVILFNYEDAFHGFATRLNAMQAQALEKWTGF
ncbi:hypothetical protein KI387_035409, partial [Taxus chinensis]